MAKQPVLIARLIDRALPRLHQARVGVAGKRMLEQAGAKSALGISQGILYVLAVRVQLNAWTDCRSCTRTDPAEQVTECSMEQILRRIGVCFGMLTDIHRQMVDTLKILVVLVIVDVTPLRIVGSTRHLVQPVLKIGIVAIGHKRAPTLKATVLAFGLKGDKRLLDVLHTQ